MKILVVTTQFPFIHGGAEIHATNLTQKLKEFGHQAELVKIPASFRNLESASNEREACKKLDVSSFGENIVDKIICLKYPAYFIRHPNKVLWLLHQQRELYDLWDTYRLHSPEHKIGEVERQDLIKQDASELRKFSQIFTNSLNVSKRLMNFSQIRSIPLYHPPESFELFFNAEIQDFLLFPGRISALKRHDLALRAFARCRSNLKLVIIGQADSPAALTGILQLIKELNLADRVNFLGFVSKDKKIELYSKCLAVLFPALDEDYGYISLEAMYASKPLVTCKDSGGSLEFVDADCGYIAEPTEESLAQIFSEIQSNKNLASTKGKRFRAKAEELKISWENVIDNLLR